MTLWQDFDAMLFDLDGVITRTATLHAAAWKRLFDEFLQAWSAEHQVPLRPFDVGTDYLAYVDGRRRYDGVDTFLRSRGIELPYGSPDDPPTAATCSGLGNRKNAYFTAELAERGVEVFDDTVELIDHLRAAGKRIAVVSASENCTAMLERAGLLDRFEVRVTGLEAAQWGLAGKPAPDTFVKAAELLGVAPAAGVVFEDAVSGVQAGRDGGFGLVVGVDRHDAAGELSRNGAHVVLRDTRQLLTLDLPVPSPRSVPATTQPQPAAPSDPRTRPQVVSTRAPVLDRTFEGIFVHLPADQDQLADEIADVVERLRGRGVAIVVEDGAGSAGVAAGLATDLTDLLDDLADRGIGSGLVLAVGWLTPLELPVRASRVTLVSVGEPHEAVGEQAAAGRVAVQVIGGGVHGLLDVLEHQLARRMGGRVPGVDEDPGWTVELPGGDATQQRVHQTLLTVADTVFGTRGVREEESLGALPRVLAAGIFDEAQEPPTMLQGPIWTGLHFLRPVDHTRDRRLLDLRSGILYREQPAEPVPVRTLRFASVARPGSFGLRAEGAVDQLRAGTALVPPPGDGLFTRSQDGQRSIAETRSQAGGAIAAATSQREGDAAGYHVVERLAAYVADADGADRREQAAALLHEAEQLGFEALLAEHRAAWAQRWRDCEIAIEGAPDLARAVRFSLLQLMGCIPTSGEAAVGPRGVAGPAYRGHVLWDADVFVLPFAAATCPDAARAMLEYRIRRLGPARELAARGGHRGARFPWESAASGHDVTPSIDIVPTGAQIPIYTGEHEEHIVSDVAWAAIQYADWTGDEQFLRGPGRDLVLQTAQYWASRVRMDEHGGHIEQVIGPDEYHELVDDNVFTNVIVRWHLRRAAQLAEQVGGVPDAEIAHWRQVADALVDHYDPDTGRYEQFAGYYDLEPLVISDLSETPVAADLLFGRERISSSQVIKQPDVLMAHHLVPEEMAPGSLVPNLEFYEPRCAHGSSLSPAIHSGLFARAGRPDDALRLFRMACLLDLDNLTGTTAGGLHIATFGGLWQAIVFGFAGLRPGPHALLADPRVPEAWQELRLTVRYRGHRVTLRATPDNFDITSDGPINVTVPGAGTSKVNSAGRRWRRVGAEWEG